MKAGPGEFDLSVVSVPNCDESTMFPTTETGIQLKNAIERIQTIMLLQPCHNLPVIEEALYF